MLRIKEYEIDHDGRQYILSVHRPVINKSTKQTEIKKITIGYYSSIQSVSDRIAEERLSKIIRDEKLKDVEEFSSLLEVARMVGDL
jgi:hypothetical protein